MNLAGRLRANAALLDMLAARDERISPTCLRALALDLRFAAAVTDGVRAAAISDRRVIAALDAKIRRAA